MKTEKIKKEKKLIKKFLKSTGLYEKWDPRPGTFGGIQDPRPGTHLVGETGTQDPRSQRWIPRPKTRCHKKLRLPRIKTPQS